MFILVLSTISISAVFIAIIIIRNDYSLSKNLLVESYLLLKNINLQLTADLQNHESADIGSDTELLDCLTLQRSIEILKDVRQLFLTDEVQLQVEKANTGAQISDMNAKIAHHVSQHLKIREAFELLKPNFDLQLSPKQNKTQITLEKRRKFSFN